RAELAPRWLRPAERRRHPLLGARRGRKTLLAGLLLEGVLQHGDEILERAEVPFLRGLDGLLDAVVARDVRGVRAPHPGGGGGRRTGLSREARAPPGRPRVEPGVVRAVLAEQPLQLAVARRVGRRVRERAEREREVGRL